MSPSPIPAPVPPAEQPDLTKMVEAAAQDIADIDMICIGGDYSDPTAKAVQPSQISAILLRHLQPLAEQLAEVERERDDLRNAGQPQFMRSEAIRLLREEVASLRGQLTALQSALAQKEKDGERLDWLDENFAEVLSMPPNDDDADRRPYYWVKGCALYPKNRTYRAAIDAARTARSESTPAAKE